MEAELGAPYEAHTEAITLDPLFKGMKEARAKVRLVVLDACRNSPFLDTWRAQNTLVAGSRNYETTRGLAMPETPVGSLVAFAASPGHAVWENKYGPGFYARAFSTALATPGLEIEKVFKATGEQVRKTTTHQAPDGRRLYQDPVYQNKLEGADLCLTGCDGGTRIASSGSATAPSSLPLPRRSGPCTSDADCNRAAGYHCSDRGLCTFQGSRSTRVEVTFETTPDDAVVEVDGELQCRETAERSCVLYLDAGWHQVTVKREDYLTWSKKLEIRSPQTVKVNLIPDFGWLEITTDPAGLAISVDGQPVAGDGRNTRRIKERPGTFLVELAERCYQANPMEARVERSKSTPARLLAEPFRAQLEVEVYDARQGGILPGADIFADGKKLGPAPGPYLVPVCTEEVEARVEGAPPWKSPVALERGALTRMRAELTPPNLEPGADIGIEWIEIPEGSFRMGSDEGNSNEKPVHRVKVPSFKMSKTEVTVAQYKACVDSGACKKPRTRDDHKYCNWGNPDREEHPINRVDWDQAQAFAKWVGARLPSEAEWEYAARGSEGRKHPWGKAEASCDYAVMDPTGNENGCGKNRTGSPERSRAMPTIPPSGLNH